MEESRQLVDHDIRAACYSLLHIYQNVPEDARRALQIAGKFATYGRHTGEVIDAVHDAITGHGGYDVDTQEFVRGFDLLPVNRKASLQKRELPMLHAALEAFCAEVTRCIADAYALGVKDGSNMLSGLATGRVSVEEYNRKTTGE